MGSLGDFFIKRNAILSLDATVPTNMPCKGENLLTNRVVVQGNQSGSADAGEQFAGFSVLNIVPPFREGCEFSRLISMYEPQNGLPLGINFELEYSMRSDAGTAGYQRISRHNLYQKR